MTNEKFNELAKELKAPIPNWVARFKNESVDSISSGYINKTREPPHVMGVNIRYLLLLPPALLTSSSPHGLADFLADLTDLLVEEYHAAWDKATSSLPATPDADLKAPFLEAISRAEGKSKAGDSRPMDDLIEIVKHISVRSLPFSSSSSKISKGTYKFFRDVGKLQLRF